MDTKRDICDTYCSLDHLSFYQQVLLNDKNSPIYSAMEKNGVVSACIPKTHIFPEFIYCIVSIMYPGKCFVMNCQGDNILQVSAQLIHQALCFLESESYIKFSDDSLIAYLDSLVG